MNSVQASPVLVIGESIMDLIKESGCVTASPGGSAANVALGLGRLSVSVDFLTSIADDAYGRQVCDHLTASGVRIFPESINAARTSTATATLDQTGHASYEFDVGWSLSPLTVSSDVKILHVGSIAAFNDTNPSIIRELMRKMEGREVTFDPNIRPALLPSRVAAVRRFEDVASVATVVKLSDEDATWLYPTRSIADVVRAVHDLGPNMVAVTRGSNGSTITANGFELTMPAASPARLGDTIGAGDTFMAIMIFYLLNHSSAALSEDEARAMVTLASAAAAITVSRRGADPPRLAEIAEATEALAF
jgi:fructokinase